jgi:hypothetical protein
MAGKSLILAAFIGLSVLPALAQQPAVSARPDGTGDPPQVIPNSRLPGPQVCKLNSQWALLRKNGQDISANGRDIVPDAKASGMAPMNCSMMGGGATGGGQMVCRTQ